MPHTGCPKKPNLAQKRDLVIMDIAQYIGSPEIFSYYKVGHMGVNGSKCIPKAILGKNAQYRVSQKNLI